MKVAIIGYGKMGHVVEHVLLERGHEITLRVRSNDRLLPELLKGTEVAIEFTAPTSAVANVRCCFEARVPIVTGTTGWYDDLPAIRRDAEAHHAALFYASNFSLGVALTNALIRAAARLFSKHQEYVPSLREVHHIHKKDAPSGTAITLAETVLREYPEMKSWSLAPSGSEQLAIEASREGDVKGLHAVRFTGPSDIITLTHEAFNRDGFALGAVLAAEWLQGRTGVFTMADMLKLDTL